MSKAAHSPTARLFQSSRLFSLPRPLPQPQLEGITSTGIYRASETATLPYPTHQAIATPASSLYRGDWGLKRPLPSKKTQHTSTPHIRVQAVDTFEHITDFASAADHTQTAAKWAEMGVPMVKREERERTKQTRESVFESYADNTDPRAQAEEVQQQRNRRIIGRQAQVEVKPRQRWKYEGPWIAGMQEGEFSQYLTQKITGRRDEWREFLRKREQERLLQEARDRGRQQGDPLSQEDIARLRVQLLPSDAQLTQREKELRDEHTEDKLRSDLTTLLTDFLDLPQENRVDIPKTSTTALQNKLTNVISDSGPPSTHPAAGLSHLRTNAVMFNHPLHGPQKHRAPVEARVVRPRTSSLGPVERTAKLGVGGIVAEDPNSGTHTTGGSRNLPEADRMAQLLDPDLVGGNKLWVHPETAYIDEKGHIRLSVIRADAEALAVRKGDVESIHLMKAAGGGVGAGRNSSGFAAMPVDSAEVAARPQSRVQGFDDVLRRRPGGGEMDGRKAAGWIRDTLEKDRGM